MTVHRKVRRDCTKVQHCNLDKLLCREEAADWDADKADESQCNHACKRQLRQQFPKSKLGNRSAKDHQSKRNGYRAVEEGPVVQDHEGGKTVWRRQDKKMAPEEIGRTKRKRNLGRRAMMRVA